MSFPMDTLLSDHTLEGGISLTRTEAETGTEKACRSIGIVIAHEYGLARSALGALLNSAKDMDVLGEGVDAGSIIRAILLRRPDVLLLGWNLAIRDEFRVLKEVSASGLQVRTILFGLGRLNDEDVRKAIQMGVGGALSEETTAESLFDSIRKVADGQYVIGKAAMESLVGAMRSPSPASGYKTIRRKFGITRREFDIITAVVNGYSNIEIAEKFSLSYHTVKHHLTHIFDKVGVSNRLELALFAVHNQVAEE